MRGWGKVLKEGDRGVGGKERHVEGKCVDLRVTVSNLRVRKLLDSRTEPYRKDSESNRSPT